MAQEIAAQLGQYKGLPVRLTPRPVTDAQIDAALETLRLRAAVWAGTDQPAARGDRVTLDFAGYDGAGTPIPDSSQQQVTVLLGSGRLLPGVEKALAGHRAGEQFSIPVTYPETFRVAALAGTSARFAITLHRVLRRQLPALDDDFARTQRAADLAALRRRIAAEKRAVHERAAAQAACQDLLRRAGENMTVTFPAGLLERQAEARVQQMEAGLRARGTKPETYYRLTGHDRAWHLARQRAEAEAALRQRLAVEQIAAAEGLTVTAAECEQEYARLAALRGRTDEAARKGLSEETVRRALLTRKVQQRLLAYADRTDSGKEEN